jgi:hypothetical protein
MIIKKIMQECSPDRRKERIKNRILNNKIEKEKAYGKMD